MADIPRPAGGARRLGPSSGPSKIIPLEGSERQRAVAANRAIKEAEEKAAKANRERLSGGSHSPSVTANRGRGGFTGWVPRQK